MMKNRTHLFFLQDSHANFGLGFIQIELTLSIKCQSNSQRLSEYPYSWFQPNQVNSDIILEAKNIYDLPSDPLLTQIFFTFHWPYLLTTSISILIWYKFVTFKI